jgi:hypothetical protein
MENIAAKNSASGNSPNESGMEIVDAPKLLADNFDNHSHQQSKTEINSIGK